jgi:hypothetical protein
MNRIEVQTHHCYRRITKGPGVRLFSFIGMKYQKYDEQRTGEEIRSYRVRTRTYVVFVRVGEHRLNVNCPQYDLTSKYTANLNTRHNDKRATSGLPSTSNMKMTEYLGISVFS